MIKTDLNIYAVIEMTAWQFDEDFELNDNENYEEKTIQLFKDNGIQNISSLDPHAYSSIKISALLNHNDLSILVQRELQDCKIYKEGLESAGPFSGGLVFQWENNQFLAHQCCGSISDYQTWVKFIKKNPSTWDQIWIGHPWIYAKVTNGVVEISDRIEHSGTVDESELTTLVQFELEDFKQKLSHVVNEIKLLKQRITTILEHQNNIYKKELPNLLIDNIRKD